MSSLGANTRPAASPFHGRAPNVTIPEYNSQIADEPVPLFVLFILWLLAALIFDCGRATSPSAPGAENDRHWPSRRRRRGAGLKGTIDPEERKRMIDAALVTRVSSAAEGLDDDDDNCCTICLEPFAPYEEVSRSRRRSCSHVFHRKCIREWLMKADECPCCRAEYFDAESAGSRSKNNAAGPAIAGSDDRAGVFSVFCGLVRPRSSAPHMFSLLSSLEVDSGGMDESRPGENGGREGSQQQTIGERRSSDEVLSEALEDMLVAEDDLVDIELGEDRIM